MIFDEEVVRRAVEYLAQAFQILKFDAAGLVVDQATEILITKPETYVKPILRFFA